MMVALCSSSQVPPPHLQKGKALCLHDFLPSFHGGLLGDNPAPPLERHSEGGCLQPVSREVGKRDKRDRERYR